jgi:hypothetical protein
MQMAEGSTAGNGSASPGDVSSVGTPGSTLGDPTSAESTAGDPSRVPTTTEPTATDDPTRTPDSTGSEPTRTEDNPVPADDDGEVPVDAPPARDMATDPVTLTEEQEQALDAEGWTPLDIPPVDCTTLDVGAAAVAHPEDFSPARSVTSTDHELILDLGGVIRRVDSYLTLPAADGHQHEIVFTDEALSAILEGVSVRVKTLIPALGAGDGHGHDVTVHSCGVNGAL